MADERQPLVASKPRWRRPLVAAGLAAAGLVVVVGAALMRPAPLSGAALAATSDGSLYAFVFDALVAQGLRDQWDCDGTYGYCGSASCSRLDVARGGADVCVCVEQTGSFTFRVDATVAFLATAPLFAAATRELAVDGAVSDQTRAELCAAHGDGSVYSSAGLAVPTASWHAPVYVAPSGPSASGPPRRRADDAAAVDVSCMGAPCWYSDAPLDGDCTLLCLCPRGYVPPGNTDDYNLNTADSQCDNHNGDSPTADSAETLELVAGHLATNANNAEIEGYCNLCVAGLVDDPLYW